MEKSIRIERENEDKSDLCRRTFTNILKSKSSHPFQSVQWSMGMKKQSGIYLYSTNQAGEVLSQG